MSSDPEKLKHWQALKHFEQRGDLTKQAEVLTEALKGRVMAGQIQQTFKQVHQNALERERRAPRTRYSVDQADQKLLLRTQDETPKQVNLSPEKNNNFNGLTWSPLGKIELMVLDINGEGQLSIKKEYPQLTAQTRALQMNSGYAYYAIDEFNSQALCLFSRAIIHDQMPIETVASLPLDFYLSPRHPVMGVVNRGAGKLLLISHENLRIIKAWKLVTKPTKKALSLAFHPDGRRIFVATHQPQFLTLIDRSLAKKNIPLNPRALITNCAVRGNTIYVLCVNPETRRPDLLILDGEKYKLQGTIALEGEAFSTGADARDILEISPDGRWAVVMVSKNQPALFTPCLVVVDLQSGKIASQTALSPNKKPVNIAFTARQLVDPKMRLLPSLIHMHNISSELIQAAFGVESLG